MTGNDDHGDGQTPAPSRKQPGPPRKGGELLPGL